MRRRWAYFDPYHAALSEEIVRLRGLHDSIVLYDAHSIRSIVHSLFEGELPNLNIGTKGDHVRARPAPSCRDCLRRRALLLRHQQPVPGWLPHHRISRVPVDHDSQYTIGEYIWRML